MLYGAVNPSGRLPYTIGKSINDYSAVVDYTTTTGSQILSIPYTEGIFIDYRHFDQVSYHILRMDLFVLKMRH